MLAERKPAEPCPKHQHMKNLFVRHTAVWRRPAKNATKRGIARTP